MEKEISILDFSLPNEDELRALIEDLTAGLSPDAVHLSAEEKTLLARSALGLTMQEAENAFCRAMYHEKITKDIAEGLVELYNMDHREISYSELFDYVSMS